MHVLFGFFFSQKYSIHFSIYDDLDEIQALVGVPPWAVEAHPGSIGQVGLDESPEGGLQGALAGSRRGFRQEEMIA